jgi:hypothetical protein
MWKLRFCSSMHYILPAILVRAYLQRCRSLLVLFYCCFYLWSLYWSVLWLTASDIFKLFLHNFGIQITIANLKSGSSSEELLLNTEVCEQWPLWPWMLVQPYSCEYLLLNTEVCEQWPLWPWMLVQPYSYEYLLLNTEVCEQWPLWPWMLV